MTRQSLILKTRAYIFDIDGVLSNPSKRIRHLKDGNRDLYDSLSVYDDPIIEVCRVCRILSKHFEIIFLTEREELYRLTTDAWISKNVFDILLQRKNNLIMKSNNDSRHEIDFKNEAYKKIKGNYKILGVFEDNKDVVEMWKKQGLATFSLTK